MADGDLTITIGGDAARLKAALEQAGADVSNWGVQMRQAGTQAGAGIAQGSTQASAALESFATMLRSTGTGVASFVAGAQAAFGSGGLQGLLTYFQGQAQNALGALVAGAQNAAGGLGSLLTQAQATLGQQGLNGLLQQIGTTAQQVLGSGINAIPALAGQAGGALANLGQGAVGAAGLIGNFGQSILDAVNPVQLLHSHVMKLVEVMGMWRLMEAGTRFLTNTVGEVFSLPETGQYQEMAWKYQYGGGAKGAAMAQQVMGWTFGESLNMPYTRQDMNSAISILNTLGLSPAGIEKYLPVIADIAASAGTNMYGQPINLQQAAMSIMGAGMGYTRMLKYDLKINPDELRQFGYVDTGNMAELMQALTKYAQVHGRLGASSDLAHNTFQGAMTSVKDRLQNFAIMMGGLDMSGRTDPLGPLQALMNTLNMFTSFTDVRTWSGRHYLSGGAQDQGDVLQEAVSEAVMKSGASSTAAKAAQKALDAYDALNKSISNEAYASELRTAWMRDSRLYGASDARTTAAKQAYTDVLTVDSMTNIKSSILGVAQLLGHDLASAISDGRDAVVGFTKGLKGTGLLDMIGTGFNSFSRWLQSPGVHTEMTDMGKWLGGFAGVNLKDIGKDLAPAMEEWKKFFASLKPQDYQNLANIGHGGIMAMSWLESHFATNILKEGMDLGGAGTNLVQGNYRGAWQDFLQSTWGDAAYNLDPVAQLLNKIPGVGAGAHWVYDAYYNLLPDEVGGTPATPGHHVAGHAMTARQRDEMANRRHGVGMRAGGEYLPTGTVGGHPATEGLVQHVGDAFSAVGTFFHGIPGAVGGAKDAVGGFFSSVGTGVRNFGDYLFQNNKYVHQWTNELTTNMTNFNIWWGQKWDAISSAVSGALGRAWKWVTDEGHQLADNVQQYVLGPVETTLDGWGQTIENYGAKFIGWLEAGINSMLAAFEKWLDNFMTQVWHAIGFTNDPPWHSGSGGSKTPPGKSTPLPHPSGGGHGRDAAAATLASLSGFGTSAPSTATNQFYISGMGYADTARLIDDVVNDRERWGGQVMHGPGGFRTWGQVGGAFGT